MWTLINKYVRISKCEKDFEQLCDTGLYNPKGKSRIHGKKSIKEYKEEAKIDLLCQDSEKLLDFYEKFLTEKWANHFEIHPKYQLHLETFLDIHFDLNENPFKFLHAGIMKKEKGSGIRYASGNYCFEVKPRNLISFLI